MQRPCTIVPIACLLFLVLPFAAAAQEANQGFVTVREIMETSCAACHDWAASHEGLTDPGRVTPGSPEKSSLYTLVADDSMPPGEPLPVTQKNLLRAWIAAGATASESPIAVTVPEGTVASAPAQPVPRRFNKVKLHQVSGFTSGALLLGAGAVGAVQWGTFISEGHRLREQLGIDDEDQIGAVCFDKIQDMWGSPLHQTLRWTHVGLLSAGEALYLYNAVTGIGMISKDRPGLTPQDLHRYGFFIHGSLMVAEVIMGFFTTDVLSKGTHEQIIAFGAAHTAVGLAIPLLVIGSGIAINYSRRAR